MVFRRVTMCRHVILASILIFVFFIRLKTSAAVCLNNTDCKQTGVNSVKCCNGTCRESCGAVKCRLDTDCAVRQKCCDSGECISRVSLCSLSSKLAWLFHFPLFSVLLWSFVFAPTTRHVRCIKATNAVARELSSNNRWPHNLLLAFM